LASLAHRAFAYLTIPSTAAIILPVSWWHPACMQVTLYHRFSCLSSWRCGRLKKRADLATGLAAQGCFKISPRGYAMAGIKEYLQVLSPDQVEQIHLNAL